MPSEGRQKKIMEKLNRAQKMLNFGASKPRVKGGQGPQGPPGSTPACVLHYLHAMDS